MRKLLPLLFIVVFLGACINSSPLDNADFGRIETVNDLEGIYQNLGEREQGAPPIYLSAVIWPKAAELNHAAVVTVEVNITGNNALTVKALRKDGVEKEDTFVEGKDFELHSGRIRLKRIAGIAGFKSGDPIVGPHYESVELGLDEKGHGKYKELGFVAGLAFLVVPIAVRGSDEVRFVRIGRVRKP